MAHENTELIASFYHAVDADVANSKALANFFDESFKDHNRPMMAPKGVPDKAVILNLFSELKIGFPNSTHKLDILAPIGEDRVVVYWTFSGTNTGKFFGNEASNNQVRINGVDIFRVKDGKFVEQWHVEELMALFSQIAPQQK
jgi:predicted SnoaL-like aldol condensation-catalyzing enzyme